LLVTPVGDENYQLPAMTDSLPNSESFPGYSSGSIAAQIQAVEQAQSPASLMAAVKSLAAAQYPGVIPALIAVFGYNDPAAAAIALGAVITWGETAVIPLAAQLDEYNYGARAYSMRALATIASVQSLEVLVKAATTDFAPSVRRAAAKGLGNLRWQDLPEPEQGAAQGQVFTALTSLCEDGDWSIRYGGVAGLQALGTRVKALTQTVAEFLDQYHHRESDRSVRARIQLAQILVLPPIQP
jgi:phycocyanobilin lyase beta subunit